MSDFFERVAALQREGQAFAVATVVARRAPVSAHLGDRAIVFADGRMDGFVGGACSREIVRKQALDALRTRAARLVSIRPDASEAASGAEHVVVPMTCASEGAIDVYVEPFVRARSLVVAGATPVASALARLARAMQYDVVRVVEARERGDLEAEAAAVGAGLVALEQLGATLAEPGRHGEAGAVVVASQGHYDDEALGAALKAGVGYVGLVASRKRGAGVLALLKESGVRDVDAVHVPAGLDLGARTPADVALSILAEIVQASALKPQASDRPESEARSPASAVRGPTSAVDPVCHMDVEIAGARHTAEVDGVTYYFCCGGCRAAFVKAPQQFLAQPS
jgi:xanthine dehydrogenase accessory factor